MFVHRPDPEERNTLRDPFLLPFVVFYARSPLQLSPLKKRGLRLPRRFKVVQGVLRDVSFFFFFFK